MKLLVLNGPNLNFLGIREPDIYGRQDFAALEDFIRSAAQEFQVEVELFQSNYEGALVEKIQWAYGKMDGIVINPAAYTHTSVAILDALKAVSLESQPGEGTFTGHSGVGDTPEGLAAVHVGQVDLHRGEGHRLQSI